MSARLDIPTLVAMVSARLDTPAPEVRAANGAPHADLEANFISLGDAEGRLDATRTLLVILHEVGHIKARHRSPKGCTRRLHFARNLLADIEVEVAGAAVGLGVDRGLILSDWARRENGGLAVEPAVADVLRALARVIARAWGVDVPRRRGSLLSRRVESILERWRVMHAKGRRRPDVALARLVSAPEDDCLGPAADGIEHDEITEVAAALAEYLGGALTEADLDSLERRGWLDSPSEALTGGGDASTHEDQPPPAPPADPTADLPCSPCDLSDLVAAPKPELLRERGPVSTVQLHIPIPSAAAVAHWRPLHARLFDRSGQCRTSTGHRLDARRLAAAAAGNSAFLKPQRRKADAIYGLIDLSQVAFFDDILAAVLGLPDVRWYAATEAFEGSTRVDRVYPIHDLRTLMIENGGDAVRFPIDVAISAISAIMPRPGTLLILSPTIEPRRTPEHSQVRIQFFDSECFPAGSAARLHWGTHCRQDLSVWLEGGGR